MDIYNLIKEMDANEAAAAKEKRKDSGWKVTSEKPAAKASFFLRGYNSPASWIKRPASIPDQ